VATKNDRTAAATGKMQACRKAGAGVTIGEMRGKSAGIAVQGG